MTEIPLSRAGEGVGEMVLKSFGRGVEGITRKKESILLIVISSLRTGTDRDRAIFT